MKYIAYRSGYKYQLAEDYEVKTVVEGYAFLRNFFTLTHDGRLFIRAGYAWDGASGPTIDTKSSMRASLVHDVLYQSMRLGLLPPEVREQADKEFYKICIEDGMLKIRAKYWLFALRKFGGRNINPKNIKRVYLAP